MTHINAHAAGLVEFERQQESILGGLNDQQRNAVEARLRDECRAIADRINTVCRDLEYICQALDEICTAGGDHYFYSAAQVHAVARLYARALCGDTLMLDSPYQWTRQRAGVDWLNQCLTVNWAGMVLAIEKDGYCHT